ncbi:MAG: type II toxin-antitoxin system Phd/YefM family antitoxin [Sporichthyaceae bacterium]
MLTATISEAKNRLSALIDRVRAGESVLILDRGSPVARLESVVAGPDPEGRLVRLQRAGLIQVANRPATGPGLTEPPRPAAGASALQALLAERRDGR